MSTPRPEYVCMVVTRVLDLTQPAPAGFWTDGRAWGRIDDRTNALLVNEMTGYFLDGRIGKEEFDWVMGNWLAMWRDEYRNHERGVPL